MLQLFRYGVVGLVNNGVMYVAYLLITDFGVPPKSAMTFLYVIGASIGFVSNRRWTFDHRGNVAMASLRYIVAHFLGYILNFSILFMFVDLAGYGHQYVQALAIFMVAGFLFVLSKFFVFK